MYMQKFGGQRYFNLTPHEVNVWTTEQGDYQATIPSDGTLRAEQEERLLDGDEAPYLGVAVAFTVRYKAPKLDPWIVSDLREGDVLIVSTLTADAWAGAGWDGLPHGVQVMVPDSGPSAMRDAAGRVTSVRNFIARVWVRKTDLAAFHNRGRKFYMQRA